MKITLNGQARETSATTLGELLRELQFTPSGLAVAINESVVRRAELEMCALNEDDKIEIIRAVQGG